MYSERKKKTGVVSEIINGFNNYKDHINICDEQSMMSKMGFHCYRALVNVDDSVYFCPVILANAYKSYSWRRKDDISEARIKILKNLMEASFDPGPLNRLVLKNSLLDTVGFIEREKAQAATDGQKLLIILADPHGTQAELLMQWLLLSYLKFASTVETLLIEISPGMLNFMANNPRESFTTYAPYAV